MAVLGLLVLLLVLIVFFASGQYIAALGSDPFGIVHFARHLSRGQFYSDFPVYDWIKTEWEPGEAHFVLGGNYILTEGRMYCKYTVGFPLVLAASIRLLGENSVYYFNILVLAGLVACLFSLALVFLRDRPRRHWSALLAPLILLVMVDPVWRLSLRPSHDLSGILFILGGVLAGILAVRDSPRVRISLLAGAAFCFGFAGTLRLPNVLAALPAGLYFLSRVIGRVCWNKIAALALLGVFSFALALSPALIQNQLTGGHPLRPPRPEIFSEERSVLGGLDAQPNGSPPPLWIGFFPTTFPDVARYFWRLWGPLFSFLFLLGLAACWKKPETGWLLVGVPLILILLYSMWVHLMTRYMLVAHPFLIILMTVGVGRLLLSRPRWWSVSGLALIVLLDLLMRSQPAYPHRLVYLNYIVPVAGAVIWLLFAGKRFLPAFSRSPAVLVLAFFAFFAARQGLTWIRRPAIFQLAEAGKFRADIDSVAPPESVVFSTKPVFQYVNLFSSSYSLRPFEMGRMGLNARRSFDRLLDRGTSLFVLDNDSYKRDSGKNIPLFREFYDVIPRKKLPADRYHLAGAFGKPEITLYEIRHWRAREASLELEVPRPGRDHLLVVELPLLWEDESADRELALELNGRPLPGPFHNYFNFFLVSGSDLEADRALLRARSDRPIPSRLAAELHPREKAWEVDLSRQLLFPERDTDDRFREERLRDAEMARLFWDRKGVIEVPTLAGEDEILTLEAALYRAQPLPVPVELEISFNGSVIERAVLPVDRVKGRMDIAVGLPAELVDSSRGKVGFRARPGLGHQLTLGERTAGSLLFDEVVLRRHIPSVEFSPLPGRYHFISFSFDPSLSPEFPPPPYRLVLDGRPLREDLAPGVQRIVLSPRETTPPHVQLRVYSPSAGAYLWFDSGFEMIAGREEFTIDLGAPQDRYYILDGFHDPERHERKRPVRWTEGRARLAIPFSPAAAERELVVDLVMSGPSRPGPVTEMRVILEEEELGVVALAEGEGTYRFPLPQNVLSEPGWAVLSIEVPTWNPRRLLGIPDSRNLGVMIDRLSVRRREK